MTHDAIPVPERPTPQAGPACERAPRVLAILGLLLAAALAAGCDRAGQQESAIEASATAALKAQGAKDARFDLQDGDVKATITQADGREQQVEVGAQAARAADFGLPFYPGAASDPSRTSRMTSADGEVTTTVLSTPDPPAKVLAFYRAEVDTRSKAGGAPSLEIPDASGAASIVVADEAAGRAIQVRIEPHGAGTEVTLLSTRRRTP